MIRIPVFANTRTPVRSTLKATLTQLGLLDQIRYVRDTLTALTWSRHNRRFLQRGGSDGLPLPPIQMMTLTTASPSVEWFLQSGRAAAASIRELLARNGSPIEQIHSTLDFGCGCGRVLRHLVELPHSIHGCDYNPKLVGWCRNHLPFGRFSVNNLGPPLANASASFDLVYALSVFTHLPQPLQKQWKEELRRVLRPDGYLIISTHGAAYLDELTATERISFHSGELVVRRDTEPGTNRCGVFCSEDSVRRHFSPEFMVRDFVASGAHGNPPQDLVLLQPNVPS